MTEEKTESPSPEPKFQLITGVEDKPKKIVIHGSPAIGKSSFATEFPDPIVVQTEDAGGLISAPRFPVCKTLKELIEQIDYIVSGEAGEYKTFVLDGLKFTESLIADYVCPKLGINGLGDDADYGNSPSFSEAMSLWYKLRDRLQNVLDAGMNVVMVSHSTERNVKDPRVSEYESTTLDLIKWGKYDPSKLFECWSDVVLYVAPKVFTKSDDTGIDGKRITAMGTGERIIYTEKRPAFLAKNRFKMPPELPFEEGKGYAVIEQYLNTTQQ